VEQCFFLTANQPQPAYKPKNSLPNRAFLFMCFFFLFCIAQFFQTGALAAITIKPASFRLIEHTCVRVGSHVAEEIHHSFYILS
jgi:hypothetical protein